jgi:hypothetical protein
MTKSLTCTRWWCQPGMSLGGRWHCRQCTPQPHHSHLRKPCRNRGSRTKGVRGCLTPQLHHCALSVVNTCQPTPRPACPAKHAALLDRQHTMNPLPQLLTCTPRCLKKSTSAEVAALSLTAGGRALQKKVVDLQQHTPHTCQGQN